MKADLPQIVIPTTYAGSEVTPILGQTEAAVKTTVSDARIVPEIVIYDPRMTYGLPAFMTVTSALNALAHAAEALYAKNRNPLSTLMVGEGARALIEALPVITKDLRGYPPPYPNPLILFRIISARRITAEKSLFALRWCRIMAAMNLEVIWKMSGYI